MVGCSVVWCGREFIWLGVARLGLVWCGRGIYVVRCGVVPLVKVR